MTATTGRATTALPTLLLAVRDVRLFVRWASRCTDPRSRDSLLWDAIIILREALHE